MRRIYAFAEESNRIEGIDRPPTQGEVAALHELLQLPTLHVADVESYVWRVAGAELRRHERMNVRVADHLPPPGGPQLEQDLADLLLRISAPRLLTPYVAHVAYETLHPFMDGNGRSGRAIWAWHMQTWGRDPFALPFLHRFYYQALDASRPAAGG